MNNFEKFNEIKKLSHEYIKGRRDRFEFLNLSKMNMIYSGILYQDKKNIEKIKDVLKKIVSKNEGDVLINSNGYQICLPNNNISIEVITTPIHGFKFIVYVNGIVFNTGNDDNFLLFLKIINNPNLIEESDFHYCYKKTIEIDGYQKTNKERFIEKNMGLSCFFDNVKKTRENENISIVKYTLDTISGNCYFECKKNGIEIIKISLENPYKIEDIHLNIPITPLEVMSEFDLNEEEFDILGFKFDTRKNSSTQEDLQKKYEPQISAIKMVAENMNYSAIKIGTHSITLSNPNNKYSINIYIKPIKYKEDTIIDTPFFINIEIKNSRSFVLHESFIKTHLIEDYKKEDPIYFKDLCVLLTKIITNKFDNFYFVYFCDTNSTISNEKDTSGYAFASFEDALLLKDGFLDKTKNFETIDLDCNQKYGIGYSGYHLNGNPSIYCAIARNEKLASFYASIIDMKK